MSKKISQKTYTLRFAAKNKATWNFIKNGKKKVETRAATQKYVSIKAGDVLILSCAGKEFKKEIKRVTHCKTINALLKRYKPELINPGVTTLAETKAIYYNFPGYEEKIKQDGLLAFELK